MSYMADSDSDQEDDSYSPGETKGNFSERQAPASETKYGLFAKNLALKRISSFTKPRARYAPVMYWFFRGVSVAIKTSGRKKSIFNQAESEKDRKFLLENFLPTYDPVFLLEPPAPGPKSASALNQYYENLKEHMKYWQNLDQVKTPKKLLEKTKRPPESHPAFINVLSSRRSSKVTYKSPRETKVSKFVEEKANFAIVGRIDILGRFEVPEVSETYCESEYQIYEEYKVSKRKCEEVERELHKGYAKSIGMIHEICAAEYKRYQTERLLLLGKQWGEYMFTDEEVYSVLRMGTFSELKERPVPEIRCNLFNFSSYLLLI